METENTPIQLIHDYFSGLKYPEIKEIKPCLMNEHGDVYLVSFEPKRQESCQGGNVLNNIVIPNAYAIVIGDKVAGYHEEFWENADQYRLVLKQHLGLLAMEAKEAAPPEPVTPPKAQEPREGYSKNKTVDAIVGCYEELLFKAKTEAVYSAQTTMAREAKLTKQLTDAQAELIAVKVKLETIKQVLEGKTAPGTHHVETPESVQIDHDSECFLEGSDTPVDMSGVLRSIPVYSPEHGMYAPIEEKAFRAEAALRSRPFPMAINS